MTREKRNLESKRTLPPPPTHFALKCYYRYLLDFCDQTSTSINSMTWSRAKAYFFFETNGFLSITLFHSYSPRNIRGQHVIIQSTYWNRFYYTYDRLFSWSISDQCRSVPQEKCIYISIRCTQKWSNHIEISLTGTSTYLIFIKVVNRGQRPQNAHFCGLTLVLRGTYCEGIQSIRANQNHIKNYFQYGVVCAL